MNNSYYKTREFLDIFDRIMAEERIHKDNRYLCAVVASVAFILVCIVFWLVPFTIPQQYGEQR